MSTVMRTMIVPSALREVAQQVAAGIMGASGERMWMTPLSFDGKDPATHYVSSGFVDETFAELLVDAESMFSACQENGINVTSEQCAALVDQSDISDEPPFDEFARLGLFLVQEEI